MYEPKPDECDLLAFGFQPSDYENDTVEIWPDNVQAVALFGSLRTQWRTGGMGGPTGLDYNVLFHRMDRMNLKPKAYARLESDIYVMELAALSAMNKKEE